MTTYHRRQCGHGKGEKETQPEKQSQREKGGEGQKHNGTGYPNTGVIKWIF